MKYRILVDCSKCRYTIAQKEVEQSFSITDLVAFIEKAKEFHTHCNMVSEPLIRILTVKG